MRSRTPLDDISLAKPHVSWNHLLSLGKMTYYKSIAFYESDHLLFRHSHSSSPAQISHKKLAKSSGTCPKRGFPPFFSAKSEGPELTIGSWAGAPGEEGASPGPAEDAGDPVGQSVRVKIGHSEKALGQSRHVPWQDSEFQTLFQDHGGNEGCRQNTAPSRTYGYCSAVTSNYWG